MSSPPQSPAGGGGGVSVSPGTQERIQFLLKGVRTNGTVIRRAGMRLRVQHESGQAWVDISDLVTSRSASPLGASANPISASPPGSPPLPSTPPMSFSTPRRSHETTREPGPSRASSSDSRPSFSLRGPFERPLSPQQSELAKLRPKLLLSLAWGIWGEALIWLRKLDEVTEAADYHRATSELHRWHERAKQQAHHVIVTDAMVRRATHAARRFDHAQTLTRGLRAFERDLSRARLIARLLRRGMRYDLRVRTIAGFSALWVHREIILERDAIAKRVAVAQRGAFVWWRGMSIMDKGTDAWRRRRMRRAIDRWARARLYAALEMASSAFFRRHLPEDLARSPSPKPKGRRKREAAAHAPWMLKALRQWQLRAACRKELTRRAKTCGFAYSTHGGLVAWQREARVHSLLIVGSYLGYLTQCRSALGRWRREYGLRLPCSRRWAAMRRGVSVRRYALHVWLIWAHQAADWRERYQLLGSAYSFWQEGRLWYSLRHWHRIAQLALDVGLAKLLTAQAVGNFDVRMLTGVTPSFAPAPTTSTLMELSHLAA